MKLFGYINCLVSNRLPEPIHACIINKKSYAESDSDTNLKESLENNAIIYTVMTQKKHTCTNFELYLLIMTFVKLFSIIIRTAIYKFTNFIKIKLLYEFRKT